MSPLNMQPSLFLHAPQPPQSFISLFPIWIISVSIPFLLSAQATSSSAVKVQPCSFELPFISKTFITNLLEFIVYQK